MGITLGTAGSVSVYGCGCLSGALLAISSLKQRHEDALNASKCSYNILQQSQ